MELDQLRSFVAVAEVRSFTRAASLAHLTQPAISRQIARLEGELGVRLFERYGRRVECTPDGKLLLPMAKAIVTRADDAARIMREHAGMVSSRVRVGSTGTVFGHLLSPVLASFIKTYPKIHLDLIERDDTLLEEGVFNGELDCAIITAWGSSRAAMMPLLTEEIMLVVRTDHKMADAKMVALADLADELFLFPGHSLNTTNLLMDACRRAGFEPKVPYRVSYLELSKALVRQGLGIALLPKMFVPADTISGLVAIPLKEHVTRDLELIYSNERPLAVAARSLALHIRASLQEAHDSSS
jgi:DNA-binding transcriptional LysR family regulator